MECLTDWWYRRDGGLAHPADGDRCQYQKMKWGPKHRCRPGTKRTEPPIADDDPANAPVPLRKRFARTLVMDTIARGDAGGARRLCGDAHSAGPSYANRRERLFCRMTDKTLWPFCERGGRRTVRDCFDEEAEVLVEGNTPVARRDVHWDLVEHWAEDGRWKRAPEGEDGFVPIASL